MPANNSAIEPMDLTPMGEPEAMKLVDRYLAGFAYLSLTDPQGYQVALTDVLRRYPQWAGEYVILQPNPDNAAFPVASLMLRKWLEQIVQPQRNLVAAKKRSEQQIEERKMIEGAIDAARKGKTYDEFKAEMAARGLPIDPGDPALHGETPVKVQEKLGITAEQWAAMPDKPPSDHWQKLAANALGK